MRRRTATLSALVVLLAVGVTVGCSDDSDEQGADDTTTTVALEPCEDVYPAGTETAASDAVESRGAPTMAGCEPASDELVVIDQVVGTGAEVAAGGTVTAHYSGVSADTGQEFDSSWSGGEPVSFPLDGVIQGWSEGLVGMKEGGRRTLVIPAELAYGETPPPGSGIAPGATLVFTVDLVSTP
jgi:peptidylprolyl isomerase